MKRAASRTKGEDFDLDVKLHSESELRSLDDVLNLWKRVCFKNVGISVGTFLETSLKEVNHTSSTLSVVLKGDRPKKGDRASIFKSHLHRKSFKLVLHRFIRR